MARGLVLKGNDYNLLITKGLQKLNVSKDETEIKVYRLKDDTFQFKVKIVVKDGSENIDDEDYSIKINNIDDFLNLKYDEDGVYLKLKEKISDDEILTNLEYYLVHLDIVDLDRSAIKSAATTKIDEFVKIAYSQKETIKNEEINIEITDDKMKSYMTLYPAQKGSKYTENDIIKQINGKINYGIKEEKLNMIAKKHPYFKKILIAEGINAVDGKNGKIEYFFELKEDLSPDVLEDGTVDYRNVHNLTTVKKNDIIGKLVFPQKGISGKLIDGTLILAKDGKMPQIKFGNNILLDEESKNIISLKDGFVKLNGNKIEVIEFLEISKDVDNSTGNIKFDGRVLVNGNVHTGFSIYARDGIEIKGVAEGAYLESDKDIILKNGMHGNEKGEIKTQGTIVAKYLSNCTAYAKEDIKSGSLLHSKISVEGNINVLGHNATIVGGIIKCKGNVYATQIGTEAETPTTIEIGVDPLLKQRYEELNVEIRNLKNQIDNLEKSVQILSKKAKSGTLDDKSKQKLMIFINDLKKDRQEYEILVREFTDIEIKFDQLSNCKLRVDDKIYPGVKITIGNDVMFVRQILNKCSVYRYGGEITVGPY